MNDEFLNAYIECALWSTNDYSKEDGGDPLCNNYKRVNIAPETLAVMKADCDRFVSENEASLSVVVHLCDADRAGHNFWLNRNCHGSGFWDEYFGIDKDFRKAFMRLDNASRSFGTFDLYVGDDGMIHGG